jgi:hypothetical protein
MSRAGTRVTGNQVADGFLTPVRIKTTTIAAACRSKERNAERLGEAYIAFTCRRSACRCNTIVQLLHFQGAAGCGSWKYEDSVK